MILSIKRSKPGSPVKIQAKVASRTRKGLSHLVGYIRTKSFRGWVCKCEDFFNRQIGKNRNCAHIREVREKYGRFGTKVPLT